MGNFDPGLSQNIMAWIGGVAAIAGLTAKVKTALEKMKFLRLNATVVGYLSSFAVSMAVPSVYLWLTSQFTVKLALLMGISMWMTASGIYDQFHTSQE